MEREFEIKHKYTDKNHKPVPELKVGDRCYKSGGYDDYSSVNVCEIRKVEVRWIESHDGSGYWSISYYIRENVDCKALKTTRVFPFYLHGEEIGCNEIYRTPQEVMDKNIQDFKDKVIREAERMRKAMRKLGYSDEQTKNLLEYKKE